MHRVRNIYKYIYILLVLFNFTFVLCLTLVPCLCSEDKVDTFPVLKIDPKDIVDTNGAGDAFVGGTNLYIYKQNKSYI